MAKENSPCTWTYDGRNNTWITTCCHVINASVISFDKTKFKHCPCCGKNLKTVDETEDYPPPYMPTFMKQLLYVQRI
ncbi:MAG: hypothetical protein Q4G60_10640 [bacterium]|nr:hypothetical protein [bacterium]